MARKASGMVIPEPGGGNNPGIPETHSTRTVSPLFMAAIGGKVPSSIPYLTVAGVAAIVWSAIAQIPSSVTLMFPLSLVPERGCRRPDVARSGFIKGIIDRERG